jgi:hypothetical protein
MMAFVPLQPTAWLFTSELGKDGIMQSAYALYKLVDKYASEIEKLDLDEDQLEAYSTVLLNLQNQVETLSPSDRIVNECLDWLQRFTKLASPALRASAA